MSERCPTCIKPISKGRTNKQNRYYWGVIVKIISDHTGFTPDEVHDILKDQFLSKYKTWDDKIFRVHQSTTQQSTAQAEKYYSEIREWASLELKCYIPLPHESEIE